jgi:U3 small nucleolar RNA-associated protein 22
VRTNIALGEKTKSILQFEIHIIPAAPENLFPELKLRPTKNSIRPKQVPDNETIAATPSPFYNASLQSDCNHEAYLRLIYSSMRQASGFRDACILGRTWLRQRGFGSSIPNGGFGHFEWAALSAILLQGGGPDGHGLLSPGYSSYQMFKAVVKFLSTADLASKPMAYNASDFVPAKSDFPVFYDGHRGQNVFFKMSPWSYELLREEATISVDTLNDSTFDQFEPTFIVRTTQPLQRYDCLVRVPIPIETSQKFCCDHESHVTTFGNRLFNVLREGLTDRVKIIDIKGDDISFWSTKSPCPVISEQSLLVAILFNPTNADRLVDHGPPAEEKTKASKFQKFWGEKAELRRFKDGRILESVVWPPGSTYTMFQDIITYLVRRHFDADISRGLIFIGEEFERLLPDKGPTKAFEALRQAFFSFEKHIRELEGLPLQLRQLSAIGSQLRYSHIDAPLFSPRQPLEEPADVLIQFEGSGRWPDDTAAIQRTKIAFLLKISALLQEFDDSIKTNLGLENEDKPMENCSFLDVIYESGASFRLRIHSDREQTLLDRRVKDKLISQHAREEAVLALSTYKQNFLQLPLHSQSITTHCTRFPFLSSSIRLVKMWFDRHMLSGHVSDELMELLVARIFLQPYPWRAPSSAMTGFLRTLMFLSRWDWRSTPLIVDFTGEMTNEDVTSIKTRLEAWRKIDPGMNRTVLLAASNHDLTGTAFTDKGPSKMVAARITALARSACKLLKHQSLELTPKSLFATSIADYDFVIHLAPKLSGGSNRQSSAKQTFKNLEVQSELDLEAVGFKPVRLYIDELEKLYGTSTVFFYSESAGLAIGGLWNPQTVSPRTFKVNLAYSSKPLTQEEGEEVSLDKASILAEIARLGGDMVSRIEVHR